MGNQIHMLTTLDWDGIAAPTVSVTELVIRGTVTFIVLILLLRIVGQREAGGLGMTDLLVVVLVADAASTGLTGDATSIADGFILVITILFWSVALDAIAYRWPRLGRILKARPKKLIEDGQLNERTMRRELLAEQEVLSQLRLHGIQDPNRVHLAYIEPNGMISILPREGTDFDEGLPDERPR